jgi:hypothetical protein
MINIEIIPKKIYVLYGEKVMIDSDLAELYGVETRVLNQAVKRNINRFPENFMFQLTKSELENWKSQIVISNREKLGLRKLPLAFTEHGALMASTILNSNQAIKMSIFIIQAFIKFRELITSHKEIIARLEDLETKVGAHDKAIRQIVIAIKQLMAPEEKPKKKIGFKNY